MPLAIFQTPVSHGRGPQLIVGQLRRREGARMAESYEDRPVRSDPGPSPPSVQAPLAAYGGAEPPAPQWFRDAIADQPER
jgi:hypothetical protein